MPSSMFDIISMVSKWLTAHKTVLKCLKCIGAMFGAYAARNLWWFAYYRYYRYPPYISLGLPFLGNLALLGWDPEKFCTFLPPLTLTK